MSLIKRNDGAYLIRQSPLQWGTIRQARQFFPVGLQVARDLSAELRGAGVACFAADDSGNFNDENYVAPTQAPDLSVVWPSDWRVEVSELGTNRYCHTYRNQHGEQSSVIGTTPQQVVDKLQFQSTVSPDVRAYLASITPEPEAVVAAPAPQAPVTPGRFLRPGDRSSIGITEEERSEMEARREAQQAPKTPPIQVEYERFYSAASSTQVKHRMKTDPEFLDWLNNSGALAPRST
jgi:hypothetical protein